MIDERTHRPDDRLLIVHASGSLTVSDIAREFVLAHVEPAYANLRAVVLDLSSAQRLDIEPAGVRKLGRFVREGTYRMVDRRSLVAPSAFLYGMCRMLSSYAEVDGLEIAVFRTLEEAVKWSLIPAGMSPQRARECAGVY